MESYTTGNGKRVIIKDLSDNDLLQIYRFVMNYNKTIKKIYSGLKNENPSYKKYKENMESLRDSLKSEIQARKLKITRTVV